MIKAILNGLLGFMKVIIESVMAPINLLLATIFPSTLNYLYYFNYVMTNYVRNYIYWFFSILPYNCRQLIFIYLAFLVSYYTVYITVLVVANVFKLIKNLKIW